MDATGLRRGSNLPAVGVYNQTLVLDLIRRSDIGLSRVELAERTGLSVQTLTNVTRRLVEQGLIVEAGKVISGPGEPRTLLMLEPRGMCRDSAPRGPARQDAPVRPRPQGHSSRACTLVRTMQTRGSDCPPSPCDEEGAA